MKKLFLLSAFIGCLATASFANNAKYTADETTVDNLFAQSQDISMTAAVAELATPASVTNLTADAEQTKTGFLIRAFFCGNFALHRSYMGTKGLWWKYFCTFGFVGCIDFWWVVIKGDEAFSKFKGNDKWVVWNDKK
jgi:hypothetical protein